MCQSKTGLFFSFFLGHRTISVKSYPPFPDSRPTPNFASVCMTCQGRQDSVLLNIWGGKWTLYVGEKKAPAAAVLLAKLIPVERLRSSCCCWSRSQWTDSNRLHRIDFSSFTREPLFEVSATWTAPSCILMRVQFVAFYFFPWACSLSSVGSRGTVWYTNVDYCFGHDCTGLLFLFFKL